MSDLYPYVMATHDSGCGRSVGYSSTTTTTTTTGSSK